MLKVMKFPLPEITNMGTCKLDLPQESWVLDAGGENGQIVIWALINEMRTKTETIEFLIVGTKQTLYLSPVRYLATVMLNETKHVFILTITETKVPLRNVARELKAFVKGA